MNDKDFSNIVMDGKAIVQAEIRLAALKVLSRSIMNELEALNMKAFEPEASSGIDLPAELARYEKDLIKWALIRTSGNQSRAAKLLNLKGTTLNYKVRLYGLSMDGFKLSSALYEENFS